MDRIGGSLFGSNTILEPQTSEDGDIILTADGISDNLNANIRRIHEPNRLHFQHAAIPLLQESATHGDFAGRLATHIVETAADLLAHHQSGRSVCPAEKSQ